MTGRLTDSERVAAGLAAAPLRPIPAPGLVVTVWGGDGIARALDGALDTLRAIDPGVVQLHTQPDATDAAVIASISTPVRARTRAEATTVTTPASPSTASSTSTWSRPSGWQRGISSPVRLAAWMPASRAVARTSPL